MADLELRDNHDRWRISHNKSCNAIKKLKITATRANDLQDMFGSFHGLLLQSGMRSVESIPRD